MPYVIRGFARFRLLPKPLKGVTLASKPPGIWRMSARSIRYDLPRLLAEGGRNEMQHVVAIIFVLIASNLAAAAAERLKFWNLTGFTIKELHLAPAGTEDWGPDQCRNDPDGAVEADERLTLKDIVPGRYNVKLSDEKGRVCIVRNIEVLAGKPYAFSISEKELTDCSK
jgi:hypothetical protein